MDRLSAGIMIALAAVLMTGGFGRDVLAGEAGAPAPAPAMSIKSQAPVMHGPSSERVLSLILTLEALRAAPVALDSRRS